MSKMTLQRLSDLREYNSDGTLLDLLDHIESLQTKIAALEDELTNLLDKVGDLPREWRVLFEQEEKT